VLLQSSKNGFGEGFETVALQIVEQRDAQLLLILALDESEVRTQRLPLLRIQVVEKVHLWGRREGEGRFRVKPGMKGLCGMRGLNSSRCSRGLSLVI
jgi:hypothetical protein